MLFEDKHFQHNIWNRLPSQSRKWCTLFYYIHTNNKNYKIQGIQWQSANLKIKKSEVTTLYLRISCAKGRREKVKIVPINLKYTHQYCRAVFFKEPLVLLYPYLFHTYCPLQRYVDFNKSLSFFSSYKIKKTITRIL